MKRKIHIFFLLLFVSFSSCEEKFRSAALLNYQKIEGDWLLERMEFTDSDGGKKVVDTSGTAMSFLGRLTGNTVGKMVTTAGDFDFTYNLTHENCSINVSPSADLPLDAPGRVNLFSIRFTGRKSLEMTAPKEYYKAEDKIIRDVRYVFTRR